MKDGCGLQVKVDLNLIHIEQILCLLQNLCKVKRNQKSCRFVCHCLFVLLQQNNWNKLLTWTSCSGLCARINKLFKIWWAALGPFVQEKHSDFMRLWKLHSNGNTWFIALKHYNFSAVQIILNTSSHHKSRSVYYIVCKDKYI